ncbi:YktB family protein [Bacillus sp. T33-2]|uniref:YktB family protein n=1 Tax=Bacillus sp. T33-2 TaxID=2054168 RepID=UPI000C75B7E2|nr:DUF1054 domain-containing protein [Bacillus sp. T33-2]PLR97435.1 DUF1054 domain-containing protein [Bacillus sp. T33-2]
MSFTGFTNKDFDVFKIEGLDERMDALKLNIRPKLEQLGQLFAPSLSAGSGDEMFSHVAKHARRTINPPKDTWVAFAANSRGYKMLPHFQIGLWESHLFIWFAVIYEAPNKEEFGQKLDANLHNIYNEIPEDFYWSADHTKPDVIRHGSLTVEELHSLFNRLQTVKKAEILCGYVIPREEAVQMSPEKLINKIEVVFKELLPLYKLA